MLGERLRDALPNAQITKLRGRRWVVLGNGRRVHITSIRSVRAGDVRMTFCVGEVPFLELDEASCLRAVEICVDWINGASADWFLNIYARMRALDGFDAWSRGDEEYLRWRWKVAIEDWSSPRQMGRIGQFLTLCVADGFLRGWPPYCDAMRRVWLSSNLYRFVNLPIHVKLDSEAGGGVIRVGHGVHSCPNDDALVVAWSSDLRALEGLPKSCLSSAKGAENGSNGSVPDTA